MKTLVSGTWRRDKALLYQAQAETLGKGLAEAGHILVTGAGTGMSQLVVEAYRRHKGQRYIAYLPLKACMEEVGEEIGPTPDEVVQTNLDYPGRNVRMVSDVERLVLMPGGLGTLTEAIHAVNDFQIRTAVFDGGETAQWVRAIPPLYEKVFLSDDIDAMVRYLQE